jgi:hypothetical protein
MCPPPDPVSNGNGTSEEMVPVDLGTAVRDNNSMALKHGTKKGFYARPSDFLSNTSNWKVSHARVGPLWRAGWC